MKLSAIRLTVLAFFAIAGIQLFSPSSALAVNPSEFLPGRIIDDEVFYDKNGMGSVAEIQAFLDAHTPPCDTWGTNQSGYGDLTNAQYAQQIMGWHGPPYVCLNNYHENPSTGATSFENGGGAFSGGISAAQIIYNAAQQYNINPKVLMVLLRRESLNLYSDSWPLKSQYKYAMGYACPDSGPGYSANCQESKAGFYKQMTLAAWQLRYYYDHMGEYNYAPSRWNTIQYNPDPACGTKDVYIENAATASLYIYTPYTPNDAALHAYPGTAYCGAYGNRNFWFFWHEWFGTPYGDGYYVKVNRGITINPDPQEKYVGEKRKISFSITNTAKRPINVGHMSVCIRRTSDTLNLDLPWQYDVVIPAGGQWTYSADFTPDAADTYRMWICNYRPTVTWSDSFPASSSSSIVRTVHDVVKRTPTVSASISVTSPGGDIVTGGLATITYSIKNNDASTISPGTFVAAVRGPKNENNDFPIDQNVSISPGQTYTYSKQTLLKYQGLNRAYISVLRPGLGWDEQIFPLESTSINRSVQFTVAPNPRISASLVSTDPNPVLGRPFNFRFSIRNDGASAVTIGRPVVAVRGPNNENQDFPIEASNITIQPGETYTYDKQSIAKYAGQGRAYISILTPQNTWNENYPAVDGSINRSVQFTVAP